MVELFRPLRVSTFVQAHAHSIMLLNATIEYAFHGTCSGKENVSKRDRNRDILIIVTESKLSKKIDWSTDTPWVPTVSLMRPRRPCFVHNSTGCKITLLLALKMNRYVNGKTAHIYLPWTILHHQDCGTCTARLLSVLRLSVDTCIITCQMCPYISWDINESLKGEITCVHKLENSAEHELKI